RSAESHAGDDLRSVALDLLPVAAAVSALAALKLTIDLVEIDRQSRGNSFYQRGQRRTVRFTTRKKSKQRLPFYGVGAGVDLPLQMKKGVARTRHSLVRLRPIRAAGRRWRRPKQAPPDSPDPGGSSELRTPAAHCPIPS